MAGTYSSSNAVDVGVDAHIACFPANADGRSVADSDGFVRVPSNCLPFDCDDFAFARAFGASPEKLMSAVRAGAWTGMPVAHLQRIADAAIDRIDEEGSLIFERPSFLLAFRDLADQVRSKCDVVSPRNSYIYNTSAHERWFT